MKQFMVFLCIAILSSPAIAAVTEGENLLINGGFDAEQVDFPEFWSPSSSKHVLYERAGGPQGKKAAIVFKSDGVFSGIMYVRQQGMVLVSGEKYKLSGYIKTKGFKSDAVGLVVHNSGWKSSIGFTKLPADSDWTFKEKTFTLFPSENKEYGVVMFAKNLTGEIHFADLKLEAVSEAARKGSSSQMALAAAPRLIPLQPLLNKIPYAKAEAVFKLYGILPEKPEEYECIISVDGNHIPEQTIPLAEGGKIIVKLAGLARGDYSLKAVIRHRKTQATILETTHPISIIDIPIVDRGNIKQLNNLVAEVLNQPVKNTATPQSFTFVNPRDGWIFAAFSSDSPTPDLSVKIDDRDTVITAAANRLEAFRELPMGPHSITVGGSRGNARLIVRSIPEIVDYPPCANSHVKENGKYDWDFMKKHILYAVTTLNGGSLPGNALGEAKARGLKWLANFGVAPRSRPGRYSGTHGKNPRHDPAAIRRLYQRRAFLRPQHHR